MLVVKILVKVLIWAIGKKHWQIQLPRWRTLTCSVTRQKALVNSAINSIHFHNHLVNFWKLLVTNVLICLRLTWLSRVVMNINIVEKNSSNLICKCEVGSLHDTHAVAIKNLLLVGGAVQFEIMLMASGILPGILESLYYRHLKSFKFPVNFGKSPYFIVLIWLAMFYYGRVCVHLAGICFNWGTQLIFKILEVYLCDHACQLEVTTDSFLLQLIIHFHSWSKPPRSCYQK